MREMMPIPRMLLLLCFVPLSGLSAGTEGCVRQVFSNYCLGGSLSEQIKQTPTNMQPRRKGDRSGVIYRHDNEKIYVMAYQGVIYKVLHTFEPKTQATLKDLRRRLQRKYGKYLDQSRYPDNTRNKARQISAVRRGDAEVKNIWQLPGQPWRVELGWNRKLGVTVAYFVNALDAKQKEAARQGL